MGLVVVFILKDVPFFIHHLLVCAELIFMFHEVDDRSLGAESVLGRVFMLHPRDPSLSICARTEFRPSKRSCTPLQPEGGWAEIAFFSWT
jgi:hypothetical protein